MPLTVSDTRNVRAYFYYEWKQLLSFNQTFKGGLQQKAEINSMLLILVDDSEYDQKVKSPTMNGLKTNDWYNE
jgi:hypothetical protein